MIGPEYQLTKPNNGLEYLLEALKETSYDGWALVDSKAGLLALGDIGEVAGHPLR